MTTDTVYGRWRDIPPVPRWLTSKTETDIHSRHIPVVPPLSVRPHTEIYDTVYVVVDAQGTWVLEAREAWIADWFVLTINEYWEPPEEGNAS